MQNLRTKESFMYAPCSTFIELNNLFFELTRQNCNLRCKNCYIQRQNLREVKDYLKLDKIKSSLLKARGQSLKAIYLTGGEPMMHPDFNTILRMCLKVCDTTVMTNGTFINEKKARFLRKIDDESSFETVYMISLADWREKENDLIRGYGNFRRTTLAFNSLAKYGFNPIVAYVNIDNRSENEIYENFREYFSRFNFEFEKINLKIIPYFNCNSQNSEENVEDYIENPNAFDCSNSRIISAKGVFACPILCDDFRARVGSTIDDFSKRVCLDTEKCSLCIKHGKKAFAHEWIK